MDKNSIAHPTWEWKCHIVYEPKYRRQRIYGDLRKEIGKYFERYAVE